MSSAETSSSPTETTSILRLKITGMQCAGCVVNVQRALEAKEGVTTAQVNLSDGSAVISGESLSPDALIDAVQSRGFDAVIQRDLPAPAALRSDIELRQSRNERQWRYRAITGIGCWIPMAVIHWTAPGHQFWVPWVLFLGSTAIMATVGYGFYCSALKAALKRTTNMDTLISIGATTAYLFSLVVFIADLLGHDLQQPSYFTEAVALLGIISLGHWLEARASARAGSAVRQLLELQPDEAECLGDDGQIQTVPSGDVVAGMRILIRPSSRIPVDGFVVEGTSDLDESIITGESLPIERSQGDQVVAGAMNTTGRLIIESTVDGRHTTVVRIAEMVQRAQASKADIQRLADRVCSIFVPAVLTIAAITLLIWWIAGHFSQGVIATVSVLIISCPCALGLATPMAVMVGTGSASRRGILVKSADALERAGRASKIIFDKTGTLTTGQPVVTKVLCSDPDISEEQLLQWAASVEVASEHPIARAIIREAHHRNIELKPVADFHSTTGQGVQATVEGHHVQIRRDHTASCEILVDDRPVGTLQVSDEVRNDARAAIEELRDQDLSLTVLSGDRQSIVESVASTLGLRPDEIIAEATPESKVEYVKQHATGAVMVGDGINDAAALAQADLGIALASGTNIAIESADIVIPGDHVQAIPETIQLARLSLRTIKQNLLFAFLYNSLAIPLAALGLLGMHGPLIAAIAMGFSDITVVGNALRLKAKLNQPRALSPPSPQT